MLCVKGGKLHGPLVHQIMYSDSEEDSEPTPGPCTECDFRSIREVVPNVHHGFVTRKLLSRFISLTAWKVNVRLPPSQGKRFGDILRQVRGSVKEIRYTYDTVTRTFTIDRAYFTLINDLLLYMFGDDNQSSMQQIVQNQRWFGWNSTCNQTTQYDKRDILCIPKETQEQHLMRMEDFNANEISMYRLESGIPQLRKRRTLRQR